MPAVGARVSLRYRLPDGAEPPFSEAMGRLESLTPLLVLRTRDGDLLSIDPGIVVAMREVPHRAVRTSEIRAVHRAIAAATPVAEEDSVAGWLVRSGDAYYGDYAAPLDVSATASGLPEVARWFAARGGTPRALLPDRLLPDRVLPVRADDGAARLVYEGLPGRGLSGGDLLGGDLLGELPDGVTLTELASGAYLTVPADDSVAVEFAASAGFGLHHGYRIVDLSVLLPTI